MQHRSILVIYVRKSLVVSALYKSKKIFVFDIVIIDM